MVFNLSFLASMYRKESHKLGQGYIGLVIQHIYSMYRALIPLRDSLDLVNYFSGIPRTHYL